MKRLIGLDYGDERIGVAVSDATRTLASPHSVIRHQGWGPTAEKVSGLMDELGAEYIVIGLPRNMDDSLGSQAREVMGFAKRLTEKGIRVELVDERLSSVEAGEKLKESGLSAPESRKRIDQAAAALILQDYLDRLPGKGSGYNQ